MGNIINEQQQTFKSMQQAGLSFKQQGKSSSLKKKAARRALAITRVRETVKAEILSGDTTLVDVPLHADGVSEIARLLNQAKADTYTARQLELEEEKSMDAKDFDWRFSRDGIQVRDSFLEHAPKLATQVPSMHPIPVRGINTSSWVVPATETAPKMVAMRGTVFWKSTTKSIDICCETMCRPCR